MIFFCSLISSSFSFAGVWILICLLSALYQYVKFENFTIYRRYFGYFLISHRYFEI